MSAPAVARAVSEDTGGTYTLLVELAAPATVEVGALGAVDFAAGWYAYVGSALGSGGFSRVRRHRELAAGERETRHWHVDYLLGHAAASLDAVVASAGLDVECAIAGALSAAGRAAVDGFGCSDCGCDTHLAGAPARRPLVTAVARAHRGAAGAGGRSRDGSD
jgi:Uri superfamily endonuclease